MGNFKEKMWQLAGLWFNTGFKPLDPKPPELRFKVMVKLDSFSRAAFQRLSDLTPAAWPTSVVSRKFAA